MQKCMAPRVASHPSWSLPVRAANGQDLGVHTQPAVETHERSDPRKRTDSTANPPGETRKPCSASPRPRPCG